MQFYFYKAVRFLFQYSIFWNISKPIVLFFKNLEIQKYWVDRKPIDVFIKSNILKEPIVRNGIFKGMKYPDFKAAGSTIYPKFMGSYENELNPIFNKICKKKYDVIIDVGSAEGYYAIGMARLFTNTLVYAFDTDEYARNLCKQIAQMNYVDDRVIIKDKLDANELNEFDFNNRNVLIICDCEGYEKQLFNSENCKNLKNCDLLIETHDLFDLSISSYLINLFKNTHQNPIIISSIDDNKKVQIYQFPETENLDLITKKIIFAEERKAIMEWLYIEKRAA